MNIIITVADSKISIAIEVIHQALTEKYIWHEMVIKS